MTKSKINATNEQITQLEQELAFYQAQTEALESAKQALERSKARLIALGQDILADNEGSEFAPGLQVVKSYKVNYDKEQAIAWAFSKTEEGAYRFPEVIPAITRINNDTLDAVISRLLQSGAELENYLSFDTRGYETVVRNGVYKDAPFDGIDHEYTLRVSARSLKTGDDLRKSFEVK